MLNLSSMHSSPTLFIAAASPELRDVVVYVKETLGALGCLVTEQEGELGTCAAAMFLVEGSPAMKVASETGAARQARSLGKKVCYIFLPNLAHMDREQAAAAAAGPDTGTHEAPTWQDLDLILANLAEEVMDDGRRPGGLLGLAVDVYITAGRMMRWPRHQ